MTTARLSGLLGTLTIVAIACCQVGCFGGSAQSVSGDATGGAAVDETVYNYNGGKYIQVTPHAKHKQQADGADDSDDTEASDVTGSSPQLATMCFAMVSCPLGVPMYPGARCYCPTVYGPAWGIAR
jgi:hypothetical protein